MSLHADGFAVTRGTALVASGSKLFMDIVGEMVADCDVGVAFPVTSEPAWLSVMRTQPSLVICDCDAPAENLEGVIAEATARHLPLLMAWSRTQHEHYAHGLVLPERVAWLTFPVVQEAFRATIDELLPADLDSVHRVRLGGAGAQIEGAVRVRALSLLAREYDA